MSQAGFVEKMQERIDEAKRTARDSNNDDVSSRVMARKRVLQWALNLAKEEGLIAG